VHGRVTPAYPEVIDRPHVRPPELEDQEHLGGPAADPAHVRQPRDDRVVGELLDPVQRHRAVDDLGRQVEQGGRLGGRKPGSAQRRLRRGEHRFCREVRTHDLDKPPVAGGRSPARQLLEDNRAAERRETAIQRRPYVQRPYGRNRARQVGVAPRQFVGRARVLYQLARLHSLFNPRCTISNSSTIAEATFLDAQTGWAVGGNGGLFVTHDGGQT
jgi:hypothetical protein